MAVHEETVDSSGVILTSQSGWLRVVTFYVLEIPKIPSDVIAPRLPERNVLLRVPELRLQELQPDSESTLTLSTLTPLSVLWIAKYWQLPNCLYF